MYTRTPRVLTFLLLIALSLVLSCLPAGAQTWQPLVSLSSFGPSATTAGAAGTTVGGGNSFADLVGGVASVNSSGQLILTPDSAGGNPGSRDIIARPAGETFRDSEQIISFTPSASGSAAQIFVYSRLTTSTLNTGYALFLGANAGGSPGPHLYTLNNGGFDVPQSPTSQTGSGAALIAGDRVTVDVKTVGVNPTVLTAVVTDVTTSTVLYTTTFSDSTSYCQVPGRDGFAVGSTGATAPLTLTAYTEKYNNPTGMSVSPATLTSPASSTALSLAELGTPSWTTGSPGGPAFVVTAQAGVGSAVKVSQAVATTSAATVTVSTTGTTPGSLLLSDPASGALGYVTVLASVAQVGPTLTTIPVTDSNVFFSPYGTFSDGTGSLQPNNVRAGSTLAQWNCDGNYVKTVLSGTTLVLDITASAGWKLYSSVDSAPWLATTTAGGAQAISLAANLTSGQHTVFVIADDDAGGEAWTSPTDICSINDLKCDGVSSPPSLLSGRGIAFWDSYGVGVGAGLPNGTTNGPEAVLSEIPALMRTAGCEYGVVASPHGGYTTTSQTNVPPLDTPGNDAATSWNKYHAGAYRTYTSGVPALGGQLSPVPTAVFNGDMFNDPAGTLLQSSAADWLVQIRAASGSSANIFEVLTPAYSRAAERTSVQAAVSASSDAKIFVIDPGLIPSLGTGTASNTSGDGIHPDTATKLLTTATDSYQVAAKLLAVPAAPLSVALGAPVLAVPPGGSVQLAATLISLPAGATDTAVTWSVLEGGGGTVTSGGLYTAPASPGVYHVTATSHLDPTKSATVTVNVAAAAQTPALVLTTTLSTQGKPVLTWTADPLATGYRVLRSPDGVTYTVVATLGPVTTYTDAGAPAGDLHYHIVPVH